jgi:hypothetical protein
MPLYTPKALHLKSIDYAQGPLFAYLYLAATSIKRPAGHKADPRGWPLNRGSTVLALYLYSRLYPPLTRSYYRKESAASPPRDQRQGSVRNLLNKGCLLPGRDII